MWRTAELFDDTLLSDPHRPLRLCVKNQAPNLKRNRSRKNKKLNHKGHKEHKVEGL